MDEQQNNTNTGVENGGSAGPIIGVIVILVLIILGGLYFWSQKSTILDEPVINNEAFQSIQTQSDSDTTSSIENDINNTDIENLDEDINAS